MVVLFNTRPSTDRRIAYFLTDGAAQSLSTASVNNAAAANIVVHTYAIGAAAEDCVPSANIQIIATGTGGTCTEVDDPSTLSTVLSDQGNGAPPGISGVTTQLNGGVTETAAVDSLGNFNFAYSAGSLVAGANTLVAEVAANDGTTVSADIQVTATNAPAKVVLNSPSGNLGVQTPTYSWGADPVATWYLLHVNDDTGTPIRKWYLAADVGCASGAGTCSVAPSISVTGSSVWWVQTWAGGVYGPWSDAMRFVAPGGITSVPAAATLVSPSGVTGNSTPTYSWNAVANSSWYLLWVNDASGSKRIHKWYKASDAGCANGGACSVTPTTTVSGSATWWIRTWNKIGYGDWSSGLTFLP